MNIITPTTSTNNYDVLLKIILCGDMSVGKTCLVSKFVSGEFPQCPLPTIGGELKLKILQLSNGVIIKAQIWDTAGQEKYKSITSHHYKKAVGAILVYDITKKSSFDNISNWLRDLKNFSGSSCIGILVGNKLDVVEKNQKRREVTYEEAKKFADENDLLFKETSALTNHNVVETFHEMIEKIYSNRFSSTKELIEKQNIILQNAENKNKNFYKCC